jgi:hypothetical protein
MDIYEKMLFDIQQKGVIKEEDEEDNRSELMTTKAKSDLIERIINECKHRLQVQQNYLLNLIECLSRSYQDTDRDEMTVEEEESLVYEDLRKNLIEIQMDLLKTALPNQHDEQVHAESRIEKTLPFNCLIDILQRFFFS